MPEHFSVVIIGAGAAGLEAAATLSNLGVKNFVVLEATVHVGGRIKPSDIFQPLRGIELGAELLHGEDSIFGDHTRELEKVWAFNIESDEDPERSYQFFSTKKNALYGRSHKRIQQMLDGIATMTQGCEDSSTTSHASRDKTLLEHFQQHFARDPDAQELIDLVDAFMSVTSGTSAARHGVMGLQQEENDWHFSRDNYQYMECFSPMMLDKLMTICGKERIRISTPVKRLIDSPSTNGIQVVVDSSSEPILADHVIVTVPISMMRKTAREVPFADEQLEFEPQLPFEKQQVLNSKLLMEGSVKVTVQLSHDVFHAMPYFAKTTLFFFTDELISQCWFLPVRKDTSKCLIAGFTTGEKVDQWTKEQKDGGSGMQAQRTLVQIFLKQLDKLHQAMVQEQIAHQPELASKWNKLPKPSSLYEKGHMRNWTNTPYVRGAYSCSGLNALNARHVLARPCWQGKLMFAGEATVSHACGTVHGALESGRRAALEVCRELSQKQSPHAIQSKL